jgi:hypothetical protein
MGHWCRIVFLGLLSTKPGFRPPELNIYTVNSVGSVSVCDLDDVKAVVVGLLLHSDHDRRHLSTRDVTE